MKELKNVLKRLQDEEVKLSSEKVDLAATIQSIVSDYKTAKKQLDNLSNLGARLGTEFDKMQKIANSVGIDLPKETIDAGKFFKALEKISI